MRIRKVTKMGGSYFIKLSPIDMLDLRLNIGDGCDISMIKRIKSGGKKG